MHLSCTSGTILLLVPSILLEMEEQRKGVNEGNTILTYEDLERIHLIPYVDCTARGVSTIMVSYSSWNGNKSHGHHFILNETLKGKLGFKVKCFWKFYLLISESNDQIAFVNHVLFLFSSILSVISISWIRENDC